MEKKLGFGCMRLPLTDANDQKSIDIPQFEKMVDLFLQRGFSYFDTAYMYHDYESERAVKKALVERHDRDSFTVTSKLPVMMLKEEGDLERIFREQLEKTGLEYFDYYWLHNINREDIDIADRLNCWDFIRRKKEEGLVRHIGFSYHDMPDLLEQILTQHPEMEYVQLQINYLDWEADNVKARENYEVCEKHGKPVIVMEPVKGGTLARVPEEAEESFRKIHPDLSPASWAIRYAASLPNVFMVLSGMSDLSQLEDNTAYMKDFRPLSQEEQSVVSEAAEKILSARIIRCTACRYCVEGCPKKIPIPEYFRLYNDYHRAGGGFSAPQIKAYRELSSQEGTGRASDCIRCGKCEKACPQHLKIREDLEKVKKSLERG